MESQNFTDRMNISWIKFIKRQKHVVNMDYAEPFENLGVFQFLKYLLLAKTIMPSGPFIRFWEVKIKFVINSLFL